MSKPTKRLWEDEDDADFTAKSRSRAPEWLQKYEGMNFIFEIQLFYIVF